jgi:imidazolonepropionase-like amidohydrolase
MKTALGLTVPALACILACAEHEPVVVIENVTVIDGTGAPPAPHTTVVIEGDRIHAVGATGSIPYPRSADVIDATGKYLIPGLWDGHVHLDKARSTLPLFAVHGVTSVRDLGSDYVRISRMRDAVRAGALIGPRIVTSGPILESAEWMEQYVDLLRQHSSDPEIREFLSSRIPVRDSEHGVRIVDSLADLGVDLIKIRHAPSPDAFRAISGAARDAGLPLAGHYLWIVDLVETADAGQGSIEHNIFPGFNERRPEEKERIFDAFARNNTHLVPTLIAMEKEARPDAATAALVDDVEGTLDPRNRYVAPEIRNDWREALRLNAADEERPPREVIAHMLQGSLQFLRDARAAGVQVMAGTDAPTATVYFGSSLHDELGLLVTSLGLTPLEALQNATVVPARFMGLDSVLGTVQVGKLADLVLLDADPLADIANTRRIDAVVVNGVVIDREERQQILDNLVQHSGGRGTDTQP